MWRKCDTPIEGGVGAADWPPSTLYKGRARIRGGGGRVRSHIGVICAPSVGDHCMCTNVFASKCCQVYLYAWLHAHLYKCARVCLR